MGFEFINEAIVVRVLSRTGKKVLYKRRFKFRKKSHLIKFAKGVKKIYPKAEVHIISVREATEPSGEKKNKKELWCSYCGTYRRFKETPLGIRKCEICDISDRDFYIKTHNNLWPSINYDKLERRKKKK